MGVAIQNALFDVWRLLPVRLQTAFKRKTRIIAHPRFRRGPQGQLLETKGEYNAKTGKITLFHLTPADLKHDQIFYYYAHECGHKFFVEYLNGKILKGLLESMSIWPLNEEEYRGYRASEKIVEIFSDVFALYLRAKYYDRKNMRQKASKIRRTLDQKAPGAIAFLDKAFRRVSRKKRGGHDSVSVFKGDFRRLERVFGKNIF